ncbi:hypothetical protein NPIL_467311 [Nephila pilipes]|uniref:Uncharacterized protein n=1 Tax=Nephila pilipes TaxID=299642 RepID=A0A8X6Q672_NEPPI|nr:hypothetical protein NPIL_467311 [Nephila pilipes]
MNFQKQESSQRIPSRDITKNTGEKASNVPVNIKEQDLRNYAKLKALIFLRNLSQLFKHAWKNIRKAKRTLHMKRRFSSLLESRLLWSVTVNYGE